MRQSILNFSKEFRRLTVWGAVISGLLLGFWTAPLLASTVAYLAHKDTKAAMRLTNSRINGAMPCSGATPQS